MTTSRQTFTQVKDILRKIDRSITDARERRLRDEGTLGPGPIGDGLRRPGTNGSGSVAPSSSSMIGGTGDRYGARVG
ncbi:MAG: hypothetical protein H6813_01725 [Phycisphaeraceae bacterium]|nr:hypothetical protein [Phycisphaeraceae bacterium]